MIALILACVHPTPPDAVSAIAARDTLRGVVELPVQGSPIVYLQASIRAGSAYDPAGQEGVASLTARMLREGGAGVRSPQDVDRILTELGAELEVVVGKELVTVRGKVLSEGADVFIPLFVDLVAAPTFNEDAYKRVHSETVEGFSTWRLNDQEYLGGEVLDIWLNEGHPYGHPDGGRRGSLDVMGLDELRAFHARTYVRDNVVLGIGGDLDAARPAIDALTNTLRVGAVPEATPKPRPKVSGRALLAVQSEGELTGVHFGHPLDVDRNHPDWPALYLAMVAFGDHRQSHGRLYRDLRTARGLNYGDYAYIEPYVQQGWSARQQPNTARVQPQFYVWLRPVDPANGPFALKRALILTERLVDDGLSEAEFKQTQAYVSAHLALEAPTPKERLAMAVDARIMGHPERLSSLPAAIEALTKEEVNQALKRWIRPDDLRIVVVTNEVSTFVDAIIEDVDTPIVYNGVKPDSGQAQDDRRTATYRVALESWSSIEASGVFQ